MNDLKKMKRILLSTNCANFHETTPGSGGLPPLEGLSAYGVIAWPVLTKYRKHPACDFIHSQAGSLMYYEMRPRLPPDCGAIFGVRHICAALD